MPETETTRPGRNDRCSCGSGKKYKRCCLPKDEAAHRAAQEKAAKTAAAPVEGEGAEAPARQNRPRPAEQPWKRSTQNTRGFQKFTGPRKVGGG